jgi:hypothetical protein
MAQMGRMGRMGPWWNHGCDPPSLRAAADRPSSSAGFRAAVGGLVVRTFTEFAPVLGVRVGKVLVFIDLQ